MTNNNVVRLVAVFVLLAAIAYFAGAFDRDFTTVDVPRLTIEADDISRISIGGVEQPMSFELVNGSWQMVQPVSARADSSRLARLVDDVSSIVLETVVSTTPERYGRYGVDSTAKTVRVEGDGLDELFFVGDSGPDFQTVFVRLDRDPRVFGSNGRLTVDGDTDRWRDKTVVHVPITEVERVSVSGARAFEVTYSDGWMLSEDGATVDADSSAVVRWLRRFSPLRADGFVTEVDSADAVVEAYEIVFWTVGGSTQSVRLEEHASNLHVSASSTPDVLRVSTGRKGSLLPETETLRRSE
jgi:hypothetical protein